MTTLRIDASFVEGALHLIDHTSLANVPRAMFQPIEKPYGLEIHVNNLRSFSSGERGALLPLLAAMGDGEWGKVDLHAIRNVDEESRRACVEAFAMAAGVERVTS